MSCLGLKNNVSSIHRFRLLISVFCFPPALSGAISPEVFSLQLWTDFDFIWVVDFLVDVGDFLRRHVVRRDDLAEKTDADLAFDVAETDVVLGTDTNLNIIGKSKTFVSHASVTIDCWSYVIFVAFRVYILYLPYPRLLHFLVLCLSMCQLNHSFQYFLSYTQILLRGYMDCEKPGGGESPIFVLHF